MLSSVAPNGTTYAFIDEVQRCADFPDVINSLRLRPNIDLSPKTLLTPDEEPAENIDGIRRMFALDWLMSSEL